MQYRRVTRACATRDWSATTHDEVVAAAGGNHSLERFLDTSRSLDPCHAGSNVMDRARDCSGPGPHTIGNLHINGAEARRAWLWRDTGELDPLGEAAVIDWMIAEGARRRGHRTDLQKSHVDLLCDSDDSWLPTPADYADLASVHDAGWIDRARQAVREAVAHAEENRRERIPVDIDKVNASVLQDEGVPIEVSASVIEDVSERWIIIDQTRPNGDFVPYEEAATLADAAMDDIDDDDIQEIFEKTGLLNDTILIEPAKHYAWCATTL
jgi:hypothetical protein